jgi:hypothetical protein
VESRVVGGQKELISPRRKGNRGIAQIAMAVQHKLDVSPANVVPFAKGKRVQIEPELKSFLDDCVIPALIREALAEISLESMPHAVPHSSRGNDSAKAAAQ